jgi:hypothetical protein
MERVNILDWEGRVGSGQNFRLENRAIRKSPGALLSCYPTSEGRVTSIV